MEGMRLQEYQLKAIDSIRQAIEKGQKQMLICLLDVGKVL